MSDDVIFYFIHSLPPEMLTVSGIELGEMLKSRKEQLPEAVDQLYKLIADQVDVVGSNKHEYVTINRLGTGNVQVEMYKRTKEGKVNLEDPIFSREFVRDETREINIYGLNGQDVFHLSGSDKKSIPVRIIGGPGKDEIDDKSEVTGPRKHTFIYDTKSTALNLGPDSKDNTSDDPGINFYDRKSFAYNTYFPLPLVYYSSDDGFVASLGMNWTTHGFRKEGYKSKHDVYLKAGTVGNIQFGVQDQWKDLLGHWDAGIKADYGFYFPYYNYFGLGNSTIKEQGLFDTDFYKVNIKGLMTSMYTETEILKNGIFKLGLLFESLNSVSQTDSIFETSGERLPGADRVTLGGISTRIYLDFRDRQIFTPKGLQFLAENTSYTTLDGASGNFGLAESYLKYFATVKMGLPVTFVMKVGGSKNYGQQIPFYKYTFLGQFSNLRGYKRNRFTGDASAYLNSEIRLHFGKVKSLFLPFETGLIGFYDVGKVWLGGTSDGGWHAGYGGGFYISPLTRDYLFVLMFESSMEEKLLVRFGIGFMMDK
ncbi:MAG: hypothetical protein DRI70_09975 [Bacteroidetes bacterium]|nr:MAG: hypothetical protein DRI70_09975 [Bacteroidota bacterium]